MFGLTCRYVRAHLSAFVQGEASLKARRVIGRHLDQCPRCEAEYRRQRQTVMELRRELPRIGAPNPGQLDAIWLSIQRELTPAPSRTGTMVAGVTSWRYALMGLTMSLLLLLPLLTVEQTARAAVPSQPAPPEVLVVGEHVVTPHGIGAAKHAAATAVMLVTDTAWKPTPAPDLVHHAPPEPTLAQSRRS